MLNYTSSSIFKNYEKNLVAVMENHFGKCFIPMHTFNGTLSKLMQQLNKSNLCFHICQKKNTEVKVNPLFHLPFQINFQSTGTVRYLFQIFIFYNKIYYQ